AAIQERNGGDSRVPGPRTTTIDAPTASLVSDGSGSDAPASSAKRGEAPVAVRGGNIDSQSRAWSAESNHAAEQAAEPPAVATGTMGGPADPLTADERGSDDRGPRESGGRDNRGRDNGGRDGGRDGSARDGGRDGSSRDGSSRDGSARDGGRGPRNERAD